MEPAIALFDLDNVLIHPGGYKAAFHASLRHVLQQINLEYLLPGVAITELFESFSVNSEWDMIPITLALVLEAVYRYNPEVQAPAQFDEAVQVLGRSVLNYVEVDYQASISVISHTFQMDETPSLGFLKAITSRRIDGPFSFWRWMPLLQDLLQNTRDLRKSYPNRLFQNYVLGSRRFSEVYRLPVEVDSESLMLLHDQSLITPEARDCISTYHHDGALALAALTFRPSLPPKEVQAETEGYSPEAEMALSRLHLNYMPLIGYGRISYLAQQLHTTPDKLIKPSPVQALAGIAAAWTGNEWQSLTWAYETSQNPLQANAIRLPRRFQLHVFEDTTIGILSSHSAVEILNAAGHQIEMYAWGISPNPDKARSLEGVGANVFANVNEAIYRFTNSFARV